jgi:hypothetical protein
MEDGGWSRVRERARRPQAIWERAPCGGISDWLAPADVRPAAFLDSAYQLRRAPHLRFFLPAEAAFLCTAAAAAPTAPTAFVLFQQELHHRLLRQSLLLLLLEPPLRGGLLRGVLAQQGALLARCSSVPRFRRGPFAGVGGALNKTRRRLACAPS